MNTRDTDNRAIVLLATTVVALDLGTKSLATALGTRGPLLPSENHSFALGLGRTSLWLMLLASLALLVVYGRFVSRRARAAGVPPWVLSLILGGALANLVDRALHEAVRDFLVVGNVVINLADVAVVVGLASLFLWPILPTGRYTFAPAQEGCA